MRRASHDYCFSLRITVWVGLALTITQCAPTPRPSEPTTTQPALVAPASPRFEQQNWPDDNSPVAQIQMVTIPPNYPIDIAVSEELQTVEDFAVEYGALAVLNGGFFDPNNGQTTSFVIINGSLVADPQENQRLIDNPDIASYMGQILNRSEFRRYQCANGIHYDIAFHNSPLMENCTLHSALGAGPQLLPTDTSQTEGFTDHNNGSLIRDAIGSQRRNARSAIGISSDSSVVWLMVSQIDSTGGMTLAELAQYMETLNIQKALNLDGGSSTSLYVAQPSDNPEHIQIKFLTEQTTLPPASRPRPVKSVLILPLLTP